jgi:hypothetical protein
MEHGIREGFYNAIFTPPEPVLVCLCGYQTEGSSTWEEAGADLDAHLEEKEGEGE